MTDKTSEFSDDQEQNWLPETSDLHDGYVDIGWKTLYAILAVFLAVMVLS